MSDFTMKLGNFEAIPEKGDDNFATSIYEQEYDGLLIARCNQNGRYPEQARAMIEGLNGKKLALDEITALRSRAEKAEAEHQQSSREWRKAFDATHQRAMKAEATCEKLATALDQAQRALASMIDPSCIAQTTVIYAFATATTAEATARHVLSEYRKESSNG